MIVSTDVLQCLVPLWVDIVASDETGAGNSDLFADLRSTWRPAARAGADNRTDGATARGALSPTVCATRVRSRHARLCGTIHLRHTVLLFRLSMWKLRMRLVLAFDLLSLWFLLPVLLSLSPTP